MMKLELIVDQPIQGHFYWTVLDLGQAGESHCVLEYAQGPLASHGAATDAGLAVLLQHRDGTVRRTEAIALH